MSDRIDRLGSLFAAFTAGCLAGGMVVGGVFATPEAVDLSTATAHVIDPQGVVVENAAIAAAAKESPGVYRVLAVETGKPLATTLVTIGEEPTPPVVVPPPPPQPPAPVPPTPSAGKRVALIVRETADATPEMAAMLIALRNGENAAYFKEKGHKLYVLDDDLTTPLADQWRPHYAGLTLPALLIAEEKNGALSVISKQPCPPSPQAVIEAIKANGG